MQCPRTKEASFRNSRTERRTSLWLAGGSKAWPMGKSLEAFLRLRTVVGFTTLSMEERESQGLEEILNCGTHALSFHLLAGGIM